MLQHAACVEPHAERSIFTQDLPPTPLVVVRMSADL